MAETVNKKRCQKTNQLQNGDPPSWHHLLPTAFKGRKNLVYSLWISGYEKTEKKPNEKNEKAWRKAMNTRSRWPWCSRDISLHRRHSAQPRKTPLTLDNSQNRWNMTVSWSNVKEEKQPRPKTCKKCDASSVFINFSLASSTAVIKPQKIEMKQNVWLKGT